MIASDRRARTNLRPHLYVLLGFVVAMGLLPSGASADVPAVNTFVISHGVGDPWGTAIDGNGHVWFAEPGCDFAPTCGSNAPPGQIGEFVPSSGAFNLYTLPNRQGNQPIFVTFDGAGALWFTTPNNDMIGEFDTATHTFVGQWPVSAGSGPWDLTFANGRLWYTQHLASAIGAFDPSTHSFQDFQTPSGGSNPYGIAAAGSEIWFTENNPSVDRVAMLDSAHGNAISEYPIVLPLSGTPHLITIDAAGNPWWTEGWSNTIATLDHAAATPGSCGRASGLCNGIHRYDLPPSTCGGTHVSGITFDGRRNRLWVSNSLSAQVGSFSLSTFTFAMTTLSSCNAHPHDGVSVDQAGNVWFDEEFANALGEFVFPPGSDPAQPAAPSGATKAMTPAAAVAPVNTGPPAIHGAAREGRKLRAGTGTWANNPAGYSFAWQRCRARCVNITGASKAAYRLTRRDIGARVRVAVTARNPSGSSRAASRGTRTVGPSQRRVMAALKQLFATKLTRRGYTGAFAAPSRGRLVVGWRVGHVHLALGRHRFAKSGDARLTISLSESGKRLLRRSKRRLDLVAKAVFLPAGAPAVTTRQRVTLSAR